MFLPCWWIKNVKVWQTAVELILHNNQEQKVLVLPKLNYDAVVYPKTVYWNTEKVAFSSLLLTTSDISPL